MSYERNLSETLKMPSKEDIQKSLLTALFNHNGTIKEFNSDETIVHEIADNFNLNEEQRAAYLERIYRKENRKIKSSLWHRLLFRAADDLAKEELVSRPTKTFSLTQKREWMLTEAGYDKVLNSLKISQEQKEYLPIKSFEVQKAIKRLNEIERPLSYHPFDEKKSTALITKEVSIRKRAFRQAIIEAYDYKCSVCGLKIYSPEKLIWEVEAAHIVPYKYKGKDDVLNGISLCRLHHWAFDVGWFSFTDDFLIIYSSQIRNLSTHNGLFFNARFLKFDDKPPNTIHLPEERNIYPHRDSIAWHRENIFYK